MSPQSRPRLLAECGVEHRADVGQPARSGERQRSGWLIGPRLARVTHGSGCWDSLLQLATARQRRPHASRSPGRMEAFDLNVSDPASVDVADLTDVQTPDDGGINDRHVVQAG